MCTMFLLKNEIEVQIEAAAAHSHSLALACDRRRRLVFVSVSFLAREVVFPQLLRDALSPFAHNPYAHEAPAVLTTHETLKTVDV